MMETVDTYFGRITAPPLFWLLSPADLHVVSNGAGPWGWGWAVPDSMWGLNITLAADVHDYMYSLPGSKDETDTVFYKNLLAIIEHRGGRLAFARRGWAWMYYQAVKHLGQGYIGPELEDRAELEEMGPELEEIKPELEEMGPELEERGK